MSAEQRFVGSCKWYNIQRRYGFVTLDAEVDGERDIYVRVNNLKCPRPTFLREGDRVALSIGEGKDGKKEGQNVTQVDGSDLIPVRRTRAPRKTNPDDGTAATSATATTAPDASDNTRAPRPRNPRRRNPRRAPNTEDQAAATTTTSTLDGAAPQTGERRPPRARAPRTNNRNTSDNRENNNENDNRNTTAPTTRSNNRNNTRNAAPGDASTGADAAERKPRQKRRRPARRPSKYSMKESDATQDIKQKAIDGFREKYGSEPQFVSYAAGRVNLIGEHVDYCDGFCFPFSIHLGTCIAGKAREPAEGPLCRVRSLNVPDAEKDQEFDLDDKPHPVSWVNYVKGVMYHYNNEVKPVPHLDLLIASNLPLGAGLSSSASLEVATATSLEKIARRNFRTATAKALLCQKAEHTFANVPCGIMDQFVAVTGKPGHAVLIDCQSNKATLVPFGAEGELEVVVANSNVKHALAEGEYAKRKAECNEALEQLQAADSNIHSWRDVTPELVDKLLAATPGSVPLKRARHVVSETRRTQDALTALNEKSYSKLGQLLQASHESLKNDFEVSCKEINTLVDIARRCDGVFGARLTGGGFGGSIVVVVAKGKGEAAATKIAQEYKKQLKKDASVFVTVPSLGNKLLSLKPANVPEEAAAN